MLDLLTKDVDDVVFVLEKWRPASLVAEKDYEAALYQHLNEVFPKAVFHQQYSLAKTRADLYVDFGQSEYGGTKVAIEIKAHLASRDEFHRLFGQLFEYAEVWEVDPLLVLCGNSDPAMAKLARKFVGRLDGSYLLRKLRVVAIP
jgi:hypothetical protein